MILCAERFDREQHLSALPGLRDFSASPSADRATSPSRNWAERQTYLQGFGTMALFADQHCRRLVRRAGTTTS